MAVAAALVLGAASASAEADDPPPLLPPDAEELTEAARRAIEGFVALVGPMLDSLGELVRDLPRYEPPEILPNGDIIIRRADPQAPRWPPSPDPDAGSDQTDL